MKWPEITWASDYNSDGSRRRPNPNAVHGWLAKWRATFSGDERARARGLREIEQAKKLERRNQRRALRAQSKGFLSSIFGRKKTKPAINHRGAPTRKPTTTSRQSSTRRPPVPSRRSTNASSKSRGSQHRPRGGARGGGGSGHRPSQQRPNNVRRTTTRKSTR